LKIVGVNGNGEVIMNSGTFLSFDDSGDTMGDASPCVDAADLGTSITAKSVGGWLNVDYVDFTTIEESVGKVCESYDSNKDYPS
jgi:hypothetical protein